MDHELQLTYDWASGYYPLWARLLPLTGIDHILEIGCYEGRTSVWFMQRYPSAFITCIDTFEGGHDHKQLGLDFTGVEQRFVHNTAPWRDRVHLYAADSHEVLRHLCGKGYLCDVVLVDGSHMAADVLHDIVFAWTRLLPGGTMILDDYGWGVGRPPHERPDIAIEAFLQCFAGQYELLEKGYQVIIRKL